MINVPSTPAKVGPRHSLRKLRSKMDDQIGSRASDEPPCAARRGNSTTIPHDLQSASNSRTNEADQSCAVVIPPRPALVLSFVGSHMIAFSFLPPHLLCGVPFGVSSSPLSEFIPLLCPSRLRPALAARCRLAPKRPRERLAAFSASTNNWPQSQFVALVAPARVMANPDQGRLAIAA